MTRIVPGLLATMLAPPSLAAPLDHRPIDLMPPVTLIPVITLTDTLGPPLLESASSPPRNKLEWRTPVSGGLVLAGLAAAIAGFVIYGKATNDWSLVLASPAGNPFPASQRDEIARAYQAANAGVHLGTGMILGGAGLAVTGTGMFVWGGAASRSSRSPPGAQAEPPIPTHVLLAVADALYAKKVWGACDQVIALAVDASGLTDSDRARLHLLSAMRWADNGKKVEARKAIEEALRFDVDVEPPQTATSPIRQLLAEARAQVPRPQSSQEERANAARKAASAREPPTRVLFTVMAKLYSNLQVDGADVALQQAGSWSLSRDEKVQLLLWHGLLQMENADEVGARASFREARTLDPAAKLMEFAPPKTLRVFEGATP